MAGTKRKRSKQAGPRHTKRQKTRHGFSSVARTRGGAVMGEMKYFDTERGLTAIPASQNWTGTEFDPATFLTFCVPVVGSAVNQRIGKQIKILKWKIRGLIWQAAITNVTVADNPTGVRLILFQDKQTNSAQAQGEQLMTDPTVDEPSTCFSSFQNIDNFGRFKVLKDKWIRMPINNATYDGTNVEQGGAFVPWKFNIRFRKPIVVRFNSTNGGTVADIIDNSLHLVATVINADMVPQIAYCSRVCYKE